MLLGRSEEQAVLQALLARAAAGRGGAAWLRGEPGIGKSALLRYAESRAADARVLRTEGVPAEAGFAYAALHRLLLPVARLADRLPGPQRHALDVVFGRRYGSPPDRFLVALAGLSLLLEAAADGLLACLIDDAHWADPATLDVLAFAARRLADEPVAMVIASREDDGPARRFGRISQIADLPLAGLDPRAARELLARGHGGRLTLVQQDRILATARGNPLALDALPGEMLRGEPREPREPLPLTARLREAFADRVSGLDERTRRVLLLIAADGGGRIDVICTAAAALRPPVDEAELAGTDDLVTLEGGRFTFDHPLVAAAVYHAAPAAERRMAHRALAEAYRADPSEPHRYALHLGRAALGPDARAAAELERSASVAARRAGQAAGAAALAMAAELSVSDVERRGRLVAAAGAFLHGGDLVRAGELLDRAGTLDDLPEDARLAAAELRALQESLAGAPADALAQLRPAIPLALRRGLSRALPLLLLYGEMGYKADLPQAWVEIADWLDTFVPEGDRREQALQRLLRAGCRARAGRDPALETGDLNAVERLTDPAKLCRAAGITWALGEYETGRRLRRKAVARARATGAAGTLTWALEFLVFDELLRSRFGTAEAYAEEGYRLALEAGQPNTRCRHQSMLALLAALQGRTREAARQARQVLVEAGERRLADCLAYAHLSLGHLKLVAGDYDLAVHHYESLHPDDTATQSGLLAHALPELIEALVRAGRHDRAADRLQRLQQWTARTSSPELRALAARCCALVAAGPATEAEYRAALALHAGTDAPLATARTQLLFGQYLRRVPRRAEARRHLRAAAETFHRIGARSWAELAAAELRAAGGAPGTPAEPGLARLTPLERRIALAVGTGATNREVAAQLFLSPRTVDYHLRKIFQKLGLRSRTQLARLAMSEGTEGTPSDPPPV